MNKVPSIGLAFLLSVCASNSWAADLQRTPTAPQATASNAWIVTLSGFVEGSPTFPGSDRLSLSGMPGIDFRRVGQPARFSAPDDGFGIAIIDTTSFMLGPVARYQAGRYFSDDRKDLFGLRKVPWSIEPGVFVEYWPISTFRARAEVRYGAHGYEGFVANVALDWVQPYDRYTFSLGPRLAFGDTAFTSAYFGVTPFEAALNGRVTPFRASGGLTSVGALATVSYTWSEQWTTMVYAGYDRLVGDAGQSPITRRLGSPDQFTIGAGVSYSFTFTPPW